MAESDNTPNGADRPPVAPKMTQRWYGDYENFTGNRSQLLEAGVIGVSDPLPGDPGVRKTYVDYGEGHPSRLTRAWKRGADRYTVQRLRPQREIDATNRCNDDYERLKKARRWISDLPASHEEFRAYVGRGLNMIRISSSWFTESRGGYSIDRSTVERVENLIREIESTVSEATTKFSRQKHYETVTRLQAEALGQSPAFAEFMKKVSVSEGDGK